MWDILGAIAFIFGGCCSNVLTLEGIIGPDTSSVGSILTFCQFAFAALEGIWNSLDLSSPIPRLKPRKIPLKVYLISVLLYYTGSVTNNSVFQYGINVPLHIVFRCSGTVITMLICWLFNGKQYTRLQVLSAALLTIGAIITSLFREQEFSLDIWRSSTRKNLSSDLNARFLTGLLLLVVSSLASSTLSVYNEWTYQKYGKHWKESLFYTHALALPVFLLNYKQLKEEFCALRNSRKNAELVLFDYSINMNKGQLLMANILTQQICIKGVNLLACHTSALTLSVVLLARKFVSLLLSFYLFGGVLSTTCYVGITTVFAGAMLYTLAPNRSTKFNKLKDS